ncbi:MAG: prolipoprotein diacylglyceryl transferase [Crocinitomicaceae bacterium]|nr:prolipoprotein diacylglyceryl transferase [Crocinitomicaceae bacterium]
MIGAIDWNVTSELIEGWATPNKYGLLFVSGLILGYLVMKRMFKREGIPEDQLEKLLIYVVFATIIGARLGHVFFYDWPSYREHPIDIFKVWEGGLASHGAAVAIIIALVFYSKKVSHRPIMWILDRVVIPVAIGATFIRLGNLVNHEIIGKPSDLPWAFIFNHAGMEYEINGQQVPRHPAQLYESIYYFFTFLFLLYLYWKTNARLRQGVLFGTFMIVLWFGRFMIEFVKEGQTERDHFGVLNTGQLLSIPLIIAGIVILYLGLKKKVVDEKSIS